jgi:predicted peroxiredoxin
MSKYLFIESRDPFENPDVARTWGLAAELAAAGSEVTMFLVQNGVLAARATARVSTLDGAAGVEVLADDLSLAERGIQDGALRDNVRIASIEVLTDLVMEPDCKPIWT